MIDLSYAHTLTLMSLLGLHSSFHLLFQWVCYVQSCSIVHLSPHKLAHIVSPRSYVVWFVWIASQAKPLNFPFSIMNACNSSPSLLMVCCNEINWFIAIASIVGYVVALRSRIFDEIEPFPLCYQALKPPYKEEIRYIAS